MCFIESLDQFSRCLGTSPFISDCLSSSLIDEGGPDWLSPSAVMDRDASVGSSTTMMSSSLAERGRFCVGRVRSITPELALRFRVVISLMEWRTVSLMRSTSFLSLEAYELVPIPPLSPNAAVREDERSRLTVNREEAGEEGDMPRALRWVEDEEIALPVPLYLISNHCPGVSRVLENHRHTFRHGYCPIQRVVDSLVASMARRKVIHNPPHYLFSSGACPEIRGW